MPPLPAAKLALCQVQVMREAGLTRAALAERLGATETAVRRLLDPDHRSHIGAIEDALDLFGKRLAIEVRDAAA